MEAKKVTIACKTCGQQMEVDFNTAHFSSEIQLMKGKKKQKRTYIASCPECHTVNTGILNYLIVWMSMFLFVLLKIGIMRLLGNVFNCNISTAAYIANTDIYNVLSTAVLIPMVLTACYSNLPVMNMIYVMGIFAAAMFVFRLLRGTVLIFAESQISKLYLFYYAVVVEIVPLLILGKILLIL